MASKPKKLPSGNWRVQVLGPKDYTGKNTRKSITAPTKAEVLYLAAKYRMEMKMENPLPDMTVRQAIERYIALSDVLSPTTLVGYEKVLRTGFQRLMDVEVKNLNDRMCQQAINAEMLRPGRYGKSLSAKTIINEWGLISTALKRTCGLHFDVRLPKQMKKSIILPEPEIVMAAIKGSSVELPCLLAMWLSFSMSEIRGLKCSDLKNGILTINRVKVDVGHIPEVKENAKVETRLRSHRLPPRILELIQNTEPYRRYQETGEDDFIIQCRSDAILKRFQKLMQPTGYKMTFHQLRHVNASVMLMLGIPEKYAMERGGWKTPHVMKSVYEHTFSKERQRIDSVIDDYFESIYEKTE